MEASAVTVIIPTIHILFVSALTLHAKKSCTIVAVTPYLRIIYQSLLGEYHLRRTTMAGSA